MAGETVTTMYGAVIAKQSIYAQSLQQLHRYGDRVVLADRTFFYGKAGVAQIAASKMNAGMAPVANHLKCSVAANASVGAMRVSVTLGATAATMNQYAEGYLNVCAGAGVTYYKIKSHLAIVSSGTGWINLYDPLQIALTSATSKVTLTKHPYDSVVVAPTTIAQIPIGVSLITVDIGYHAWFQTWGPCNCLIGAGPPTIGQALMMSTATAGALVTATAGNTIVGNLMRAEAAADYGLVNLLLAS